MNGKIALDRIDPARTALVVVHMAKGVAGGGGRLSKMWRTFPPALHQVTESLPHGVIALEQDEPRPSCSTHSRCRRVRRKNGESLPKLCPTARRSVGRGN